jgi:hypothetical protein
MSIRWSVGSRPTAKHWLIHGTGGTVLDLAGLSGPDSATLEPRLADPLRKAAEIIEDNMKASRIPNDGFCCWSPCPAMRLASTGRGPN